ncbi:hypothetical protein L5515_000796 [Caenorhabditis briggsae]|uniref:Uncharacterized protein n=1 Tax=Caenorhabditis briggsae TaxID=6238 RepID=A0AAE9J2T5_CAEBR|nr:hypothetical protein L5515_000796 [Caenorhabditis briggsae]
MTAKGADWCSGWTFVDKAIAEPSRISSRGSLPEDQFKEDILISDAMERNRLKGEEILKGLTEWIDRAPIVNSGDNYTNSVIFVKIPAQDRVVRKCLHCLILDVCCLEVCLICFLKLLFLGSLCRLSASSSTPSNATSEDSVFLRIDTSLDAHSRLEAALNTLAELINPTKPNSSLGKYFLLDDSIISELTNVDGTHADRIFKELTDLKYNLTAFNEKSKQFKMFEKLHQLINTTVIPGKSEKDEVEAIIGGWDKFDVLEFNLLKFHGSNLKNLEHSKDGAIAESRVRGAAARRFQQFWRRSRREYQTAINGAKVIKTLEGAIVYEIRNKTTGEYKVDKGKFDKVMDEVIAVRKEFIEVLEKLESFINIKRKIGSFSSWKLDDVEKWLKHTSEHLRDSTDQTVLSRMPMFSNLLIPTLNHLLPSPISLTEYNVTQKFQSASILFKLFDRVIQASAGFDTFFKQGDLMNIEFQNLRYDDPNRRGWVEKMKILESVKSKFFDMKNQILKGREFYTPVSIENLMSLRWLVENLADISNPALQISQWSDFVLEIKNSSINLTAVDALLRFLKSILAAEKVSNLTFWDYNKNWIKIVGFCFVTIFINAVIYAVTLIIWKERQRNHKNRRNWKSSTKTYSGSPAYSG